MLEKAGAVLELAQPQVPINIQQLAAQAQDPLRLAYLIGSMLSLDVAKEQALLEAPTRAEALRLLHEYLTHEIQVLELRQKITSQAETEIGKQQREYVLRQQMRRHPGRAGREQPGEGGGRGAAPPAGRGRPARGRPQGGDARADPPGATAAGRAGLSR